MSCSDCIYGYGSIPCETCPIPKKAHPMSHEDQMNCDRPDAVLGRNSTMNPAAKARAMDPEMAALNAIVTRLDSLDRQQCERILEYCVVRFLDTTLRDDGR